MKIAVASIMQETCSFNPVKMDLQDFKGVYFKEGADVVNVPPEEWVIGAFVAALRPRHADLVGIISTISGAGGEVKAETFAELKEMLLTGLTRSGPFDAIFLALHGAMAAVGEPDTEGVLLTEVRKLVGPDCFIGVSLDHHANVTPKMVAAADVMVGYDTQPHDLPASGAKTARVMLDIWDRKRKPHGALVKIPMITPQDKFLTASGPMKEWFDLARELEKDPSIMAASPFPTQPWMDVPNNGWSCLVYADTAAQAQAAAEKLAQKAWGLRAEFWRGERLAVPATVVAANAEPRGVVVISDTGDSVWGGAYGDSTALLIEMLKQGVTGPALLPVVDAASMEQAIQAGVGQKLTLQLGGKNSADFSPPVAVSGTVEAIAGAGERGLGDGRFVQAGRSVLFASGGLKIAILERRDFCINSPVLYETLGLDVSQAKMVVLKTASNFQFFRKYQSRLIRADSPGATQSDLTTFKWKHISRPIYPLDDLQDWRQ